MKIIACLKLLFLFSLFPLPGAAWAGPADKPAAADALLNSPTLDMPQARQALALYEELLPSAGDQRGPLLARAAHACFVLGDMAPDSERQGYYDKGRAYAERLLAEDPAGAPGHYWLALNLCGLADAGGALKGRQLLPRILEELQKALARDEAYDHAGAHRILGRIYFEAPRRPFSVGDLQKSLEHLSAAVRLAPDISTNHLYLAETLIRLDRPDEARRELQQALTAPRHAVQPQGLAEDRQKARQLLAELGGK